ncbi:MAG TPA: hypothetical protein VMT03_14050 [Polyangia bacterium]|nr:hypothetical protein [Polyangia bacterium]
MRSIAVLLLGALSACQYAVPEAQGAAPQRRDDAGLTDAAAKERQPDRRSSKDSLVGLTRKQLLARRGAPTRKEGGRWIYTSDQSGCRDRIVNEVVTFEGDRVARVTLQFRHTTEDCGIMPGLR